MSCIHLLLALFAWCVGQASGQVQFDTMNGPVRGERVTVNGKSLDVFLSIPFAKPPVGNLRFKPPQPVDTWQGVLNATKRPPACLQSYSNQLPETNPRYFSGNFSEDCLYLSIWKPTNATGDQNVPVMLWIYGGSFSHGMTDLPLYNGQYLSSENDVIVVSVNYRVGPFGFGYLGTKTMPGNMGLLDQLEAMKLVKNNIANFGGDPNKITLFGESAGSYSVGLHLLSPLSKDLFQNVIMQSGSPLNNEFQNSVYSHSTSKEHLRMLAKAINCSGLSDADIYECLMNADSEVINTIFRPLYNQRFEFYPVVDGYFLVDEPLKLVKEGLYKKTNVMLGVTKDEVHYFSSLFFNPMTMIGHISQKKVAYRDLDWMLHYSLNSPDKNIMQSVRLFYESRIPNPTENFLEVLNQVGSDLLFKCPVALLTSLLAMPSSDNVFLYSLNYRVSTLPLPLWAGVPHTYDNDLVFGLPLDANKNYTDEDKEVSRLMMRYWTNFAKSGNPNSPETVITNWLTFESKNQTFMALDSGSNLATRQGFRREECTFVNNILPMISKEEDSAQPTTTSCKLPINSSCRLHDAANIDIAVLVCMVMSTLQKLFSFA